MSRRSCFQFTNIARERTGRGSGSRSALGSSVRRRRAGARAAAQSQVGGRCGGARGRGGSRSPAELRHVAPAKRMRPVRPLFLSFLCATGRTSPKTHGAEDYAFICVLGQGLELDAEEGDRAMAAAESPRLLLLGGGLLPVGCPGPHGRVQDFLVRSVAQEEINRLCLCLRCPERDD